MGNNITLVIIIVNSGYSEKVMDIAKDIGAKGGTVFNAVGSAGINAEKLYGVTINPDKEIIMILVSNQMSSNLLKITYEKFGASTEAQGIAFTMPVDEATSNLLNQYKEKNKTSEKKSN